MRPRDLLFLQFAAGARPSSLRPWLLGPGRRRLRRKRRRRRRRWLRRRRRPAQPAMSLAAAGDAPVLASARWNPGVHGGSRLKANCSRGRSGSQGPTTSGPTAARAALRACARTRWKGRRRRLTSDRAYQKTCLKRKGVRPLRAHQGMWRWPRNGARGTSVFHVRAWCPDQKRALDPSGPWLYSFEQAC